MIVTTKLISLMGILMLTLNAYANNVVKAGTVNTINSKILNEARTYYVGLPVNYEKSNETYPVVYVLDGDVHRFKAIAGIIEAMKGLKSSTSA